MICKNASTGDGSGTRYSEITKPGKTQMLVEPDKTNASHLKDRVSASGSDCEVMVSSSTHITPQHGNTGSFLYSDSHVEFKADYNKNASYWGPGWAFVEN